MPCPFKYPDTPVNQARGVVGCTLQCDQKLTCPGQQTTDPQKTPPAMAPQPSPSQSNKPAKSRSCTEGKHWSAKRKICVSCAAGASWNAGRSVCSCGEGQFVEPKTNRCISCPENWRWQKGACVCTRSLKSALAGKACSPTRPVCMTGSSWDAANKHCVDLKLQKPKASLEIEFAQIFADASS